MSTTNFLPPVKLSIDNFLEKYNTERLILKQMVSDYVSLSLTGNSSGEGFTKTSVN